MRTVTVRKTETGGTEVKFTFLGHTWNLVTVGSCSTWMLRREGRPVYTPVRHYSDLGAFGDAKRILYGTTDTSITALKQAKFQLLRLRYRKPTPTFHEQYSDYSPAS